MKLGLESKRFHPTSFCQAPMTLSPLSHGPIPSPLPIELIEPRAANSLQVCPKAKVRSSRKKQQTPNRAQEKSSRHSNDDSRFEQDEAIRAQCMPSTQQRKRGFDKLTVKELEERTRVKFLEKQAQIDAMGGKKGKGYWRLRKHQIAQELRLRYRREESDREIAANTMDSVIQTLYSLIRGTLSPEESRALTVDINLELAKVNANFESWACKK